MTRSVTKNPRVASWTVCDVNIHSLTGESFYYPPPMDPPCPRLASGSCMERIVARPVPSVPKPKSGSGPGATEDLPCRGD
ncbi:hypothetical protein TNCV_1945911 [Trichonephila clavipes]|uniref:Uncharacterized protein n=1 Tax=Trichonephila clavipes TaxID=2585209 RepID=A0A8X6SBE5_TRICX|nr:hypothetical protein TNCV_1945911 [Trichonephila clavipes]